MYPKKRAFWIGTMINFDRPDLCHDPFKLEQVKCGEITSARGVE